VNNIEFFFVDIQPISIDFKSVRKYVNKLIINELKQSGNISIIFCSDDYLLEVNKQYLNHDYYTDIITFDYVEENIISGDLYISINRVKENSEIYENQYVTEIYRVIFHGILHLVGYKDKTEDDKKLMTDVENFYLSKVNFNELKL